MPAPATRSRWLREVKPRLAATTSLRAWPGIATSAKLMLPVFAANVGDTAMLMEPGGIGIGWIMPAA